MADRFYTSLEPTGADWSNSSRGYKANNVVGDIAEAAGDALKMGVAATDEYYKGTIKEEAKTATNSLFGQYGNDAAVSVNAGVMANTPPKDIQKGVDQLGLLKQAAANGTLKDSSFWAQAELISRQLKTRYPGYWEHIDSTMGEMLGRKPAPALHAELMQELNAGATKEDKEYQEAVRHAREAGIVEPFVSEAQGKKMSPNEINTMTASRNAIKWKQEYDSKEYSNRKARNDVTEEDASLAARKEAQSEMLAFLSDSSSSLFKSVEDYRKYANDIETRRSQGLPVNPAVQAAVTSAATQVDNHVNNIMNKYMLKYGSDVPGNKLADNLKFLQDWAKNYTTLVSAGDKQSGAYNTALVKSLNDADLYNFLASNDAFRKAHTLKQALGEQIELAWEGRRMGTEVLNQRDLAIEKAMADEGLLEGISISDSTKKMQDMRVSNPQAYSNQIDIAMNGIVEKDIPSNLKPNLINRLYGNKEFLSDVKENERRPMFFKMSAPVMTKEIKALYDAGKITPADYQKHLDWITTNAINLVRDNAAEINSVNTNRKSGTIFYNTETNRLDLKKLDFEPQGAKSGAGKFVAKISDRFQTGEGNLSMKSANEILDRVAKLAKLTDQNESQVIQDVLQKAGIEINLAQTEEDKKKIGPTGAEPAVIAVEKGTTHLLTGFAKLADPSLENPNVTPEEKQAMQAALTKLWPDLFGASNTNPTKPQ